MQANLCRVGKFVKIKSFIPSTREHGMDFFVTCAFIITIILNPHLNKCSKRCDNFYKSISTSSKSVVTTTAHVKDCQVVLENISSSCDTVKLKMLSTSQENTYTASLLLTKEERLLEGLSMKTPIAWGKANGKHWTQLYDVSYKLKNCNSLTERPDLLQNVIYNEAANIFGHSQPPKRNLAEQSRRTKLSIQLIKEKNLLTAQISTIFLPDQRQPWRNY